MVLGWVRETRLCGRRLMTSPPLGPWSERRAGPNRRRLTAPTTEQSNVGACATATVPGPNTTDDPASSPPAWEGPIRQPPRGTFTIRPVGNLLV
jgi:hypothetical protein